MNTNIFPTITRDQCIKLRLLDNGHTHNTRSRQMELLEKYLEERGYTYYQWAAFCFMKDLAVYESSANNAKHGGKKDSEYPECLLQSYRIMFNAFDEFLKEKIGDHYELQGWDDPMGEIIWCEDHFDREEAIVAYNQTVAENNGGYIMLRKVDKEGMPINDDITACNF